METAEILEELNILVSHPDDRVAHTAMLAAERIRELRDQLIERVVDEDNATVTDA